MKNYACMSQSLSLEDLAEKFPCVCNVYQTKKKKMISSFHDNSIADDTHHLKPKIIGPTIGPTRFQFHKNRSGRCGSNVPKIFPSFHDKKIATATFSKFARYWCLES